MATLNKDDMLTAMSAHVRAHGLAGVSLRPLARAAGTSDRMLIYHFGSKDGLMAELLARLADQMTGSLEAALPAKRSGSAAACLGKLVALMRTPTFAPDLRLWLDILSGMGRGDPAYVAAGARILAAQADWITTRLPNDLEAPEETAQEMLVLLQGVLVLDAAGGRVAADAALARFKRTGP